MLPDTVRCLDIEDSSRSRPSDDQVWQMIIEMIGVTNSSAFRLLEDKSKRMVLKELKNRIVCNVDDVNSVLGQRIDWNRTNMLLANERRRSINFLKDNLK